MARSIVKAKPAAKKAAAKKRPDAKKASGKPAAKTPRRATAKAAVKKPAPRAAAKKAAAKAVTKVTRTKPKDGRAPNSSWLIPSLTVRSAEAAIDFYQRAFGFTVDFTMPGPGGGIGYAQLRYRGALVHLSPEGSFGGTTKAPVSSAAECPAMLYVYCADVDALTARARAAGAQVISEPADMFWGDRMSHMADPDGYRWSFATNVGSFDPAMTATPADYPAKQG